ncbi:MAG: M20/M25/M40 family metallo-hydrolase, partial [Phycisphaerae bacterium]
LSHIEFLASDEIGGRGVGTPGIARSAKYIADQFSAAGIEPAGEEGTFFARVDIPMGVETTDQTRLALEGAGLEGVEVDEDYRPFAWSSDEAFDGELAFVGYGLVNADRSYDDYAGIDVRGKVVLMLRREPPAFGAGGGFSALAHFDHKVEEAVEHGASAVLIVNRKPTSGGSDRLFPLFGPGQDYGLPAFHITRALAETLLDRARLDSLDELQEKLDADTPEQCSTLMPNLRASGQAGLERRVEASKNVVGMIRGKGRNADEFVAIGAHYDHLGTSVPQSMFGNPDRAKRQVHNGADDNASGTAALIELGKALSRWPGLNRSVLLIAFTGEELGLHGSRRFVEQPTVGLDKIVALLNVDMIGRMPEGSNLVSVYGTGTAEHFDELIERCASDVGLKTNPHRAGSGRSDDASFYSEGIPAVHFFTGLHDDYHRPTDDTEKINEADAVRVVEMMYLMARELIDKDQAPTYRYVAGRASLGGAVVRAVMGIWPDISDEGASAGILVGRTAPNGPAEKAGVQAGDRIIRLDGRAIDDLAGYLSVTGDKKPGDVVELVVDRQGKQITMQVTLASG